MYRQVTLRLINTSRIQNHCNIICQSRVLIVMLCCLLYGSIVLEGNAASLPEIEMLVNGQKSVVVERGKVVTISWNAEIVGTREPAGVANQYPRIFRQLGDANWRGIDSGSKSLKGSYTFDTSSMYTNQTLIFVLYCQGINGDAGGSVKVTAVEKSPITLLSPVNETYSNGMITLSALGSIPLQFNIEGQENRSLDSDGASSIQNATFTNLTDGIYFWRAAYQDGSESTLARFFLIDTVPPQANVSAEWLNLGEHAVIGSATVIASASGNPNGAAVITINTFDNSSGLGQITLSKIEQGASEAKSISNFTFFNYSTIWKIGDPLAIFADDAKDGDVYIFTIPDMAGNITTASVTVSETSNTDNINQPNSLTLPSATPTVTTTPTPAVDSKLSIVSPEQADVFTGGKVELSQLIINTQSTQTDAASWTGIAESPLSPHVTVDSIMAESPATFVTCDFDRQEETYFGIMVNRYVCTVKYTQEKPYPVPQVTVNFSGNGFAVTGDYNGWKKIISPGSISFIGNASSILALGLFSSVNKSAVALQVDFEWTSSDILSTPTPTPTPLLPSVQVRISQGTGGIAKQNIEASHSSAGYFKVTWESQNAQYCEPFGDWNLPQGIITDTATGEFILSGFELSYFNIDRYADKDELIFGVTCTGLGGVSSATASVKFTDMYTNTSMQPSPTPTTTPTPIPATVNELGLLSIDQVNISLLGEVSVNQLIIMDTTPPLASARLQSAVVTGSEDNPNISAIFVLNASDSQSGLGRILLDKNGQNIDFNFFNYDRTTYTEGTPLSVYVGDAKNGDVYTFTVQDRAGNISFASVTVMIEGVPFNSSISLISPDDNSFNKGKVELHANGNSQLTFVIRGPQLFEILSDVSSGRQNVTLADLPEGQYDWWAENQDGKRSTMRSFQVDTTPPQVYIISDWIKPGQTVGIGNIQASTKGNPDGALHLQIYVKDNLSGIAKPSGLAVNGKTGTMPVFYEWSDYYGKLSGTFSRLDNFARNGDIHTFYYLDRAGNEGSMSVTVVVPQSQNDTNSLMSFITATPTPTITPILIMLPKPVQ